MAEWTEVGVYSELSDDAKKEANRLAEYALDVALNPAEVIRFEETEDGRFRLVIHEDLFTFYQGL